MAPETTRPEAPTDIVQEQFVTLLDLPVEARHAATSLIIAGICCIAGVLLIGFHIWTLLTGR